MTCIKTGCSVDFDKGHVYAGDAYQCPICNQGTISTNYTPSHDPGYKYHDHYLPMASNQIKEINAIDIEKYLSENFLNKDEILLKKLQK